MTSNSKHDRRPTLACEIAADRVLAGRAADAGRMVEMASARVVLLDFETLPSKRDEAEAVVRFRLKKSLPFDPADARISYHAQSTGKSMRAVAAVVLNTVLQEYESAFRDAGYNL